MITKNNVTMSNRTNWEIYLLEYLPEDRKIDEVIIAIHGFGSTKASDTITMLADSVTKHNIAVIALDLPAHGESKTERLRIDDCISNLLDAEDYIKENFKESKIGYFASSLGAYLTLLRLNKLEREEDIDKVVLRCAAIDMKNILKNSLLDDGFDNFEAMGYADLGFAKKVHVTMDLYNDLVHNDLFKIYNSNHKILLVHGTEDECAPYEDAVRFEEENENVGLKTIVGAGHRFLNPDEIEKVIEYATNYFLN